MAEKAKKTGAPSASRRKVAKMLLKMVDERNARCFGLSKKDLQRLREAANGKR